MTTDSLAEELLAFIRDIAPVEKPDLNSRDELIDSDILDSFALEELYEKIGGLIGRELDRGERVRSNFETVAAMVRFVADASSS